MRVKDCDKMPSILLQTYENILFQYYSARFSLDSPSIQYQFTIACQVNSFASGIRRIFKDLFAHDLVDAFRKSPELLLRISGTNIISGWSPFNAIIFLLRISESMLKWKHVGRLVSQSELPENGSFFPLTIGQLPGYRLMHTHVHKLIMFNRITRSRKVMRCTENFCRKFNFFQRY